MTATATNGLQRLLASLLLTVVACAPSMGQAAPSPRESDQENTIRIYKKVAPATVFITAAFANANPGAAPPGSAIGAGLIWNEQGLILTNAHVVEGATRILVHLYGGTRLPAEVIGSDPATDLTLLRVALPKEHRAAALLGDSDHLEVGQKVLAIGHPFGLGYALTTGIISGLGAGPESAALLHDPVIQTSAPINPGNSGGPLVDQEGRVIGINTTILAGAQNIGFAIPIGLVKGVVGELHARGRVVRPWLGITGRLLTDDIIDLFALPLAKGVLIAGVAKGSPAERAGLRAGDLPIVIKGEPLVLGGDILLAVNGQDLRTPEQYATLFKSLKVGQTISMKILRDGTARTVTVTLEERPAQPDQASPTRGPEKVEFRPLDWRGLPLRLLGPETVF